MGAGERIYEVVGSEERATPNAEDNVQVSLFCTAPPQAQCAFLLLILFFEKANKNSTIANTRHEPCYTIVILKDRYIYR